MIINHLFLAIFLILDLRFTSTTPPTKKCGLYGQPPCSFVPAPPGMTPKCASPGTTFCEHNANYPTYIIQHLVEKFGYHRILVDEQKVDFSANKHWEEDHHHQHHFYGPQMHSSHSGYKYDPPRQFNHNNNVAYNQKPPPVPEPIYIPKPQPTLNYHQYVRSPAVSKPKANNGNGYHYPQPVTQYSPADWLKRYSRDLTENESDLIPSPFKLTPAATFAPQEIFPSPFRHTRSLLNETVFDEFMQKSRTKRQTFGRQQLCETRETFVVPQAALNTKGNWMYVVNHEDSRQLVKSETCASTECSNLCIVPNGYNSRCEQKFAQKRLLSLDSNGQNLYTDTFWFPSCCVCTLSNQG